MDVVLAIVLYLPLCGFLSLSSLLSLGREWVQEIETWQGFPSHKI